MGVVVDLATPFAALRVVPPIAYESYAIPAS